MGGRLQILQLLQVDCTGAEQTRMEKPQVLVELCKQGVSLTQTAMLERHLINHSSERMEGKIVFISHAQLKILLCLKRFFQYK